MESLTKKAWKVRYGDCSILKPSNRTEVKEIHLTGRLHGEPEGVKFSTANIQGPPHICHSCEYVLKVLRALSEKLKNKSEESDIYSRRNSFHLWYTKYLQLHADDCLQGTTEPVSSAVWHVEIESPLSVSQSWLRWRKEKHRMTHQQPRRASLMRTTQLNTKKNTSQNVLKLQMVP